MPEGLTLLKLSEEDKALALTICDGMAEESKMIDAMHKVDPSLLPKAVEPSKYRITNRSKEGA